jgi:hypothetical protein
MDLLECVLLTIFQTFQGYFISRTQDPGPRTLVRMRKNKDLHGSKSGNPEFYIIVLC